MITTQAQNNKFQFSVQTVAVVVASSLLVIGFVLYVGMDLATHSMFYPLAATGGFAAFFALPALVLLWRSPLRVKLALISTFLLLILVVRNAEWNSRKPFLRTLEQVQAGMTTPQVDALMRGFARSPRTGVSDDGTVGYRHTDEGWGNSDVGLVTFQEGQVVRVEYLSD